MRIISISNDNEFVAKLTLFCKQNKLIFMPSSNDVITLNHLSFYQPDYVICDYTSLSYMTFDVFLDMFRPFDATFWQLIAAVPSQDFELPTKEGFHILDKSAEISNQLLWIKKRRAEPQPPAQMVSVSSNPENIHFFRSDPKTKQKYMDADYVFQIFQCMQHIKANLLAAKSEGLLSAIDSLFSLLNQGRNYKYCANILLYLNTLLDTTYVDNCHMEPPKHLSMGMFQIISDALRYYKHQFLELSNLLTAKNLVASSAIYEILNYINSHYMEDLTLDSISLIFHFNPSYLSSKFRKETMLKLVDYINFTRIYLASQLLAVTSIKVTEIAEIVGYSNSKYFFRVFKKQFKLSPSEYRKRCSVTYSLDAE